MSILVIYLSRKVRLGLVETVHYREGIKMSIKNVIIKGADSKLGRSLILFYTS